ncbi:MAG: leucine-rich repeat domain-containing protein [Lachnospiraceae bacterium]|nr:leucine-rich repeat domain-containing protein [Lachnospiraceae bacterium]
MMKQRVRGIFLLLAVLAGLFFLAGCGNQVQKTEEGLTYWKPENLGGYDFLTKCKDQDVYICDIREVSTAELTVPSEFKGKPVVAVIGSPTGGNSTLTSLKIGEGVLYLERIANLSALKSVTLPSSVTFLKDAFENCPLLEEIVFPGKIGWIGGFSFRKCSALQRVTFREDVGTVTSFAFADCPVLSEVRFEKSVGELQRYVFQGCFRLTAVELPAGTVVEKTVFERPYDYDPAYLPQTVLDYDLAFDAESLRQAALSVLGEALDPQKEISQEEAQSFADRLNGPILVTETCPDCYFYDYAPEALPKEPSLRLIPVSEIEYAFSGTVYTPEKAAGLTAKSQPPTYCLFEYIGYADGPQYNYVLSAGYYLWYRVSLREADTGNLLAWYTVKTGYAPASFTAGKDRINYDLQTGDGTRSYFLNQDGTKPLPFNCVIQDFFGVTERSRQTEIRYRAPK